MMKQILITLAIVIGIPAVAQETVKTSNISLEIDPAPFILGGYSFSIKYSPKEFPKTAFMASVYGSDLPDAMMSKQNKEKGWSNLRLETSYAIFAEFYLKNNRRGFYFGPSVFLYRKSVQLNSANERTKFKSLYPNLRAGYIWYPFKKVNVYLNPWVNIGSEINIDTKNRFGEVHYEANKLNYIAALHIGYSLDWQ